MKNPSITWHAGALNTEPNTIKSLEIAVENHAEIIEIDVTFRPDGTPVIIHADAPAENEGVLFDEAIKVISQGGSRVNLDIKSTANLHSVDEIINKYKMFERVFYTGVFDTWVEAVKSNSQIPYFLNHAVSDNEATDQSAAQAVADKAKNLGAYGINSRFNTVSRLFADIIHENGLEVSLWTVDNEEDMIKVIELNPDNITTRKPDKLSEILNCK